ncbi:DUF2634 domain-containing protein [Anaerotruncus sp. 1XD22-93]|nr:DUF2634 domain-containing protein [Lachnospiraceae bacterium]NBI76339.1 DUF2634 domain-containing protein [Lachnospiraceae bacterium]RKJ81089.1 DUF2634 domain-containing protein [Anaerotruncus sp. 1XD22-93]
MDTETEEIGLFPEFEVPDMDDEEDDAEEGYKRSVFFDVEAGDFRMDGAGRMTEASGFEAYMQWCMKAASTQRYACLAYPDEIGTELEEDMQEPTREAVESAVENDIVEALMVNPRTEYVNDFTFDWDGGRLTCSFLVKGKDADAFRVIGMEAGKGG